MGELIDLFKSLFGVMSGDVSVESPREFMLRTVLEWLLNPTQANLDTQSYFDKMTPFLTLAIPFLLIEFCARCLRSVRTNEYGEEAKQFGLTGVFLFGLIPVLPGFLLATQAFFNAFGRWVAFTFVGSDDPDEFVTAVSTLSGNGGVDFILSLIQIAVVVVLGISISIVPLALWSSAFFLIVGVCTRWIKSGGEPLFKLSVSITLYALLGNMVGLLVISGGIAASSSFYADEPVFQALANTGTLVAAAVLVWLTLKFFKAKINAVATGVAQMASKTSGKLRSGFKTERGSDNRQRNSAISKRQQRAKNGGSSETTGDNRRRHQKESSGAREQSSQREYATAEATPPRHATTAARSRRHSPSESTGRKVRKTRTPQGNNTEREHKNSKRPSSQPSTRPTQDSSRSASTEPTARKRRRPTARQTAKGAVVAAKVGKTVYKAKRGKAL